MRIEFNRSRCGEKRPARTIAGTYVDISTKDNHDFMFPMVKGFISLGVHYSGRQRITALQLTPQEARNVASVLQALAAEVEAKGVINATQKE